MPVGDAHQADTAADPRMASDLDHNLQGTVSAVANKLVFTASGESAQTASPIA